jgi:hypothetical protein
MLNDSIVNSSRARSVFATDGVNEAASWQGALFNEIEPAFNQRQQLGQRALLIHRWKDHGCLE